MRHADLLESRENAVHGHRINVPASLQDPISYGRYREGLHTFVEGLQDKSPGHGDAQTPRFHAFKGLQNELRSRSGHHELKRTSRKFTILVQIDLRSAEECGQTKACPGVSPRGRPN